MKIAITGTAGFVGMHLSQFLLTKGYTSQVNIDYLKPIYGTDLSKMRVLELERNGLTIEKIDLSNCAQNELEDKLKDCEVVIHLAANAGVRNSALLPDAYSKSNVIGFVNLLEAVRVIKPSLFMFASSSSVYGNNSDSIQHEESANGLNLASYYAATKWSNEILAQSYARIYDIQTVALRFFTVYGNYGRPDMAYMSFLDSLLTGKEIEIYGTDGGRRSYSHVSDVVSTIHQIMETLRMDKNRFSKSDFFQVLNIGNPENSSAIELLDLLEKYSGRTARLKHVNRPMFDVDNTKCSMEKTFSLVQKFDFLSIERGIASFTPWYLDYFSKR